MSRRIALTAAAVATLHALVAARQPGPQGASTIWNGVYSEAQAARGRTAYAEHCARCHGEQTANPSNPLWGERFAEHWDAHTLADLFHRIRDTMPPGGAAVTVDSGDKLDAMAFVLRQNGFPAGTNPLPLDDDALARVQIIGRTGVAPPQTGTLVRVFGCLTPRGERDWQLANATEPERTALTTGAAGVPTSSDASGKTVALLNPYPNPAAHRGHRMMVTGFLIRNADGDAVNVVSLEMIAAACTP